MRLSRSRRERARRARQIALDGRVELWPQTGMTQHLVRRRSLVLFPIAAAAAACAPREAAQGDGPGFAVDVVAGGLNYPWSLAFLPNGDALITEKMGGIRLLRADGTLAPEPVAGGPQNVFQEGQSGLHEVTVDPQFAENGFVYVSFLEGDTTANRIALYKARFDGSALVDGQVIFRATPDKSDMGHPSARILFLPDETLLLAVGDGYDFKEQAQNLRSHLGKILRLTREGAAAADNPFVGRDDALPEIYSYGHRNTLGLALDARDGAIWQHENGPRGGDELNLLKPGANYGWPLASYGIDYDGTIITPNNQIPDAENAVAIFSPSIAPSGMVLYLGDAFPEWQGDFLIGALTGAHLRRVRVRDNIAVLEEVLLHDRLARIRDVRVGPQGHVYLLTDSDAGEVLRVRPA
ncbi:PQQ-dependent oxidoreductase of gdhB family [alpha proteobacterium U9-1i]|nr:PQQ-dependent oxidoreductase of gdhB family [alpha proteobacterium U9-1i]